MIEPLRDGFSRIAALLDAGRPLTIALVNDVGFVGGAGKALRRQAQSFLLDGHRVGVVCGMRQGPDDGAVPPPNGQGFDCSAGWLGARSMPETAPDAGMPRSEVAARVADAVAALRPDLVVTGNFHWLRWPLSIIERLAVAGTPTIAYLHDMHWISGRCAYAGSCRRFVDGCDAQCPTPKEYPPLEPDRIADAWRERRRIFVELGVPLAANSRWMADRAIEGFAGRASVTFLPLALDARRFAPIDRSLARRLLGIEDRPTALVGAIDMGDRRKGGHLLPSIVPSLVDRGAQVLAFGHNSQYLPGVRGLGYIEDERVMPVVLSASDLFLNVSLEESFGQTLMEAAACAVPSVAIARGGIPDIARDGENAVLVADEDPFRVAGAACELLADPSRAARLGAGGRALVEREFSLEVQAARWRRRLGEFGRTVGTIRP